LESHLPLIALYENCYCLARLGVNVRGAICSLGTWQVQRLFEKQELLARVEEKMHGQTIPLPQTCVQQCWVRLQGIILVQLV
jgi:cytochrome oxidase assembly protein ShyY1